MLLRKLSFVVAVAACVLASQSAAQPTREQQQAGRGLVQPVHGEGVGVERLHPGAGAVGFRAARHAEQAGGLVDDDQAVVRVHDPHQRDDTTMPAAIMQRRRSGFPSRIPG